MIFAIVFIGVVSLIGVNRFAFDGAGDKARSVLAEGADGGESGGGARIGQIDDGGASVRGHGFAARDFSDRDIGRADRRSSATANREEETSQPLKQEEYIAALMAQLEKDGLDNALLHYALAFELAPDNPTAAQMDLIKRVMEEGWSEDAEELLPYLEQWEPAFAKLYEGAHIGYARGLGSEMGMQVPVPRFLIAQNSARMLGVYSRYLESQGRYAEAAAALEVMMNMGRDFKSPDNILLSGLIGTAVQNMALRQIASLAEKKGYAGSERQFIDKHRQVDVSQGGMTQVMATEMKLTLVTVDQLLNAPESMKMPISEDEPVPSKDQLQKMLEVYSAYAESVSDYLSKPYWDRDGSEYPHVEEGSTFPVANYLEAEVRHLYTVSKMRQQQIDLAAQAYMNQNNSPAPDLSALVNGGYLPESPVDPFSGQDIIYKPTGDSYEIYGSGPDIDNPMNPDVDYSPSNGTISDGVIRLR